MLADNLKVLLASTQSFAIKSQNFHWNVEGSDFPQYHEFFDTLYGDVSATIDRIAEYIRILGHYTPGSLTRYAELSIIQDQTKIPRAELMFQESLHDCEVTSELVIENYMAELQDLYGKKAWFIRSILKKARE